MKHPATHQLFAYWNRLRGDRTAPERSDIDPTAIRDILADTFMLDVDVGRRFPFRLAGTRVNGLFDADQKGRPFLDLWRAEERRNIAAVLMTVVDGACPVVAGALTNRENREEATFELLLLPLRHHGRTHARVLGLIKPTATPAWLGLLPAGPLTLRSLRILDLVEAVPPGDRIAVNQSGFEQLERPKPGRSRPFLKVIQGGRSD